jgi:hypothetical protein
MAEGTIEGDGERSNVERLVGVTMDQSTVVSATKASVKADQFSVGDASHQYMGQVSRIGGSLFWDPTGTSSIRASAQVALTLQPIYLGNK